jgi:hypothetical protein
MKIRGLAALAFTVATGLGALAYGDGAIICTSDSTGACAGKQYCCYKGGESEGDKMCKQLGCKRGGTSSCPTAANVHSCGSRVNLRPLQMTESIDWCVSPPAKR